MTRRINLTRAVTSDAAFARWLTTGALADVEFLVLWNARLTDSSARRLAEHPAAVGLRALDLSWNRIGPEGMRALAESPHLSHLETLRLYHNDGGPEGARAVSAGRWRLQALNLCGNAIGPKGAAWLAEGPSTLGLRSLHLGWVGLGDDGLERLAARRWSALSELNVRDNGIRRAEACVSGAFPRLRQLGLDDNPIEKDALAALAERIPSINVLGCDA